MFTSKQSQQNLCMTVLTYGKYDENYSQCAQRATQITKIFGDGFLFLVKR